MCWLHVLASPCTESFRGLKLACSISPDPLIICMLLGHLVLFVDNGLCLFDRALWLTTLNQSKSSSWTRQVPDVGVV